MLGLPKRAKGKILDQLVGPGFTKSQWLTSPRYTLFPISEIKIKIWKTIWMEVTSLSLFFCSIFNLSTYNTSVPPHPHVRQLHLVFVLF